ncbi:CsbD family protein [Methylobacterium ajmalii]|uniref:CsbD family protein n=1 Tax=Methylobacterium ajmalii TaxID=2738439 RepID=A0ABU9ZYY8_9HYPH
MANTPHAKALSVSTDPGQSQIKGLANEAVGNIKQGIGSATGNDKLQAEGKAQELKGEAQKTTGDVKDGIKNAADTVKSKL